MLTLEDYKPAVVDASLEYFDACRKVQPAWRTVLATPPDSLVRCTANALLKDVMREARERRRILIETASQGLAEVPT